MNIQDEILAQAQTDYQYLFSKNTTEGYNNLNVHDRMYYAVRLKNHFVRNADKWARNNKYEAPELEKNTALILAKIIANQYRNGWKARGAILRIVKSFEEEEAIEASSNGAVSRLKSLILKK